jgi:hypothetical protein
VHLLKRVDPTRAGFALLLAGYFSAYLRDPGVYLLLDHVDLAIHEAGHVLFAPLGEVLSVAGGTVMQIIAPAVFVAYFARRKQRYSAAIVLFWLAQSLFNVAVYMGDARAQVLPLVGGEDVIHDWNYMLTAAGWLEYDNVLAGGLRGLGFLVYVSALGASIAFSRQPRSPQESDELAIPTWSNSGSPFSLAGVMDEAAKGNPSSS